MDNHRGWLGGGGSGKGDNSNTYLPTGAFPKKEKKLCGKTVLKRWPRLHRKKQKMRRGLSSDEEREEDQKIGRRSRLVGSAKGCSILKKNRIKINDRGKKLGRQK